MLLALFQIYMCDRWTGGRVDRDRRVPHRADVVARELVQSGTFVAWWENCAFRNVAAEGDAMSSEICYASDANDHKSEKEYADGDKCACCKCISSVRSSLFNYFATYLR